MSSLTSTRLLRLLSLFQARRDWTGGELAERLDVTPRTVRRDVQRLRDLGYPVDATPGVAGGYRLGAGSHLPPLLLDDEETVAVAVGLRTAASGGVLAGIEETSVRALAKLEQILPSRLRRRVSALHTFTDTIGRHGAVVDGESLTVIAGCCRDSERLRFVYKDHHGAESRRIVEPTKMVHAAGRWYLLAWDVNREDWRVFRIDRMEGPLSSGPRFSPRTPPDEPAAYVAKSISSSPYSHSARVRIHAPEEKVRAFLSPLDGVITPIDEESCEFQSGGPGLATIAVHLLFLGFDFTVVDPPELLAELQGLRDRLDRSLAGSSGHDAAAVESAPTSTARQ